MKLKRKDKWKKESSLHFNWITYTVYWQEYGVQMYVVEVEWDYLYNKKGIYLEYLADECGWYGTESMDEAKSAVEKYLTNILHYNLN